MSARMIRSRLAVAVSAICLFLLPAASAKAKSPGPERQMLLLERKVSREEKIQLETAALQLELEHPRLSGGNLSSAGESVVYKFDDVEEIRAYRKYAGRGAGIGLLGGLAVGGLLGAWASAMTEPSQRAGTSDDSGQTVALMAAGGGAGFVIGALLGAASSGWKTIYRRPAPDPAR